MPRTRQAAMLACAESPESLKHPDYPGRARGVADPAWIHGEEQV